MGNSRGIKEQLKQRLLEISVNYRGFREQYRLSDDLKMELRDVEPLLKELVGKNILKEKLTYICPICRDTSIMDDELLHEIIDEDGYFQCENCMEFVNSKTSKTGYIYYDVKDKEALINW